MAHSVAPPAGTGVARRRVRPELLRLLDDLPPARQTELLDFARFLHQQAAETGFAESPAAPIELRLAPATTLAGLTGIVALGGDAVVDTEALYDDTADHR
jgi:hypothetical protein